MKKVLVTSRSFGKISKKAEEMLKNAGMAVDYMSVYDKSAFERMIPEYDALIIGAHSFPPELLERCPKLKIICKHGIGLDNIPVEACREHHVCVTNTPGTNSDAVADFAVLLMLASARKLIYSTSELKKGNLKPEYGTDLNGKTVGLLGFGAVARRVAVRVRGFDCRILAYDPYVKALPEDMPYVSLCGLEEILKESDFISLHLPITEETRGMIGKQELEKMKPSAYLINTARGGIIDEAALYEAVDSGAIAGAALDVLETEPVSPNSTLLRHPHIIVTNHVASYSCEALDAVSLICAGNIVKCLAGEEPLHRVV
jgi:D-3-phosphoglycerate dehydrogenase